MTDITFIIHTIFTIISVILNTLLILLILTKSPKQMGSYKYLMIFMSSSEVGFSIIDVLVRPEQISIGTFWIVGTNSQRTVLPMSIAYPLVLIWGASYGVTVAGFGVQFIFRYLLVIGNRKWVSGVFNMFLWLSLLVISGFICVFAIHVFLKMDDVLKFLIRQDVPSLNGIDFDEMAYYGFSLYKTPPSLEFHWIQIKGMALMGSIVTFSLITMIFFGVKAYLSIQKLVSLSENLCSQSKSLQTQLFYALLIQTIIPIILIHIPSTFVCINPFFGAGNEIFARITIFNLAFFPAIDPLPSLIIVRPYRQAIMDFLPVFKTSTIKPNENHLSNNVSVQMQNIRSQSNSVV